MLRRTRRIMEYDFRWSHGTRRRMCWSATLRCIRKRSMQTTMTSEMIHQLLSAEGRVRLRTVEYFGWLILAESVVLLFTPYLVEQVLH